MKFNLKSPSIVGIIIVLLFVTFSLPVFSASSDFILAANEYFDKHCTKENINRTSVLGCYLFEKVQEQQTDLDFLKEKASVNTNDIATQSAKIIELEERIYRMENPPTPLPTPTPAPGTVIVLSDGRPASFQQQFTAIPGTTSMTFNVSSTEYIINWALNAKFGGESFYREQHRFRCNGGDCDEVTLPVLSGNNLFSLGTSSGLVDAIVTLNSNPNELSYNLGTSVSLPFTSTSVNTDSYNEIIINAGQQNPQNLTGIKLQRFESGSWVTKHTLSCDGGAECQYQPLPLLGGDYRIILEGSGSGAMLSALFR